MLDGRRRSRRPARPRSASGGDVADEVLERGDVEVDVRVGVGDGERPLLFAAGGDDDAAVDVVQPGQGDELVVLLLDERLVVGDLAEGEVDAALGRDADGVAGEVVLLRRPRRTRR